VRAVLYTLVFGYAVAALRRAYAIGWIRSIGAGIVVFVLYLIAGIFVFAFGVGILQNLLSSPG
jgi:hypothetical protein